MGVDIFRYDNGNRIAPAGEGAILLDNSFEQMADDYLRVEQAIRFLERNVQHQPSLKEIAESVNLSEYHFQRLFTRWVGISPKRFLQFLTKENAKRLLERSGNLLSVAYDVGLSGPGRLHDLFVSCEAVTPGEYKSRGEGLEISYGFHASPFGECLVAQTGRGVCRLAFVENGDRTAALGDLKRDWPEARLAEDAVGTHPLIYRIFGPTGRNLPPLALYLNGTNFQIKVWEALLRIPPGAVTTYEEIAASIGAPRAARAVGNAVGSNPIPVIIPCHRVIRKTGLLGNYRYGSARKKALLGWEMAKAEEEQ
jgi:AraC family transcriptional regulator, regulatory protein of adaptative response / methylated-DNA-[protein]-cysteine methyltransferase